jgi:hypothetical protein
MGRCCPFNLTTESVAAANDHQIQLGTGVRRPEKTLFGFGFKLSNDMSNDKSFPGSTEFGMRFKIFKGSDVQKGMHDPAVMCNPAVAKIEELNGKGNPHPLR